MTTQDTKTAGAEPAKIVPPLAAAGFHVMALSMRHCWPGSFPAEGGDFRIDTHVADVAAFIGAPSMNFLHGELIARDGGLHFMGPAGTALRLPRAREAAYARAVGSAVVLGVRPDHILHQGAPDGCSIRMTVRDVEPLGPHTLVIGSVAGAPFTAQMPVGVAAQPDQPFEVALDLDRAHLFDKATGQVIVT